MAKLVPLSKIEHKAVELLLDAAFGRDRIERTAYKVRAGVAPIASLSFAALGGGELLGTAQSWPVLLKPHHSPAQRLIMVGPVAVRPDAQDHGIGQMLTDAICEELDSRKLSATMIGDPEYYERFFGFVSGPAGGWTLPGPVEPHRILLRAVPGADWPAEGTLGPDILRSAR
ncbi:MAG: N-acetyltransferase [Sphingomonadaceae bacterium]|nr:N-acetyltransferase [Sphingomonadaceae bacterium]